MSAPCLEPGCGELVVKGPRCPEHKREYDRETHRSTGRIYNRKRWHILRRVILLRDPLCRICEVDGIEALSEEVDHVIAIEDGGAAWDEDNLQGLCGDCHSRKTRAEMRARTYGTTPSGVAGGGG
jgi:5-methylcytosine-specific restriction enzyme A